MKTTMRTLMMLGILAGLTALSACQSDSPIDSLLSGRVVEYDGDADQSGQSLQYPPDLLSTAQGVEGTVSLSEYTIGSIPTVEEGDAIAIEAPAAKVTYRRGGSLRWIEIDLPPNEVWGLARGFWTDHLGFALSKENPELGIMETEWLDLRERIGTPGGFLTEYVDKFLNRLNDSGERDKFVTRLERNDQGGTDIYISHRYVIAQFDKDGLFSGYERQRADNQLEIEMLRRSMLYFAGRERTADDNEDIEQQIAGAEAGETVSPYRHEDTELYISKPFDESWQLVQVGLNRGGFSIEDRDYQEGIIYIRHSGGPETDKIFGKAETNFFNRLFGEQKPILRDIKLIFNHEADGGIRLTTEAVEEDDPLTPEQSSVVLELLNNYLP